MYSVLIKGFTTQKEAEDFIAWYDGQGEQDAVVWFECCNEENDGKSPTTVYNKNHEAGTILEMNIEMK